MQAIARVNRVFKDKPGGLIVDYLGLAYELKLVLSDYTEGDREETGIPQAVAVGALLDLQRREGEAGVNSRRRYAVAFMPRQECARLAVASSRQSRAGRPPSRSPRGLRG
jgi:hypothetical protein